MGEISGKTFDLKAKLRLLSTLHKHYKLSHKYGSGRSGSGIGIGSIGSSVQRTVRHTTNVQIDERLNLPIQRRWASQEKTRPKASARPPLPLPPTCRGWRSTVRQRYRNSFHTRTSSGPSGDSYRRRSCRTCSSTGLPAREKRRPF